MKARYVKTLENLSEHARKLHPLWHGDHVFIQNQAGRFPKKWDRSGVIVETKENDQYVVKVAGTGRLALRNRRFLRKYTPHFQQGYHWRCEHPSSGLPTMTTQPVPHTETSLPSSPSSKSLQSSIPANTTATPPPSLSVTCSPRMPPVSPPRGQQLLPRRLTPDFPTLISTSNVPPAESTTMSQPTVLTRRSVAVHQPNNSDVCRSTRIKYQKQFYDPTSGEYVGQNPK